MKHSFPKPVFWHASFACFCVLLITAGCGTDNPLGRRAISGTVTLDGEPLAAGNISFTPENDASGTQTGGQIHEGAYSLPVAAGLPPGKYLVRIFASPPESNSDGDMRAGAKNQGLFKDPIPPEYNVKSQQYIEVAENGPSEFDFAIQSKTQ